MSKENQTVESFAVDHLSMKAPQVRKAGISIGPGGDKISKFDLRFLKPNSDCMTTAAVHTLEHLLATFLRNQLDNVIDLSPMGCRTGFYFTMWGDISPDEIKTALINSLKLVLKAKWEDVPGTAEHECGNYQDHSLSEAQKYAQLVLTQFENK